ncbi:hypothetical protein Q9290_10120 [Oceanimonas sp. CHS3-5]|uniref:hypothetical protein n=1 Tax=Oceanimonas sp. CHS3-5 TaxID=3068186 RepID=UPI00273F163F|nr:hypothetical protein [Oceanimonas sp. CHS3-5]MDP5292640.1 hypothetical protein [Oceanimonas sp. CHS3-5]
MKRIIGMVLFTSHAALAQGNYPTAECQWTWDRIQHLKKQIAAGDNLAPTRREYHQRLAEFRQKRCARFSYRQR